MTVAASTAMRSAMRRALQNGEAYAEWERSQTFTVGDKNGSTVFAAETPGGKIVHTRLTLDDHTVALTDNAGVVAYLGTKLYDFPAGGVNILSAIANLAITKSSAGVNADWDGDFALGTATANSAALLTGTQQDILPSTATPQAVSGATTATGMSAAAGGGFTDRVSLQDFKLPATLLQLAATASAGILALVSGTHGSASPSLLTEDADAASKTDSARMEYVIPWNYKAGSTITLRVRAKTSSAPNVAATIDALVYKSDLAAGISADLCATDAIAVTSTIGNKDFTITPTGLEPGDKLDVLLTFVVNDTGGSGAITGSIYNVEFIYGESSANLSGSKVFDGTATAKDLYLNVKVDDADHDVTGTACNFIFNGTVDIVWVSMGDY